MNFRVQSNGLSWVLIETYERDFVESHSDNILVAFNSTPTFLKTDKPYFEGMVNLNLQLNRANASDTISPRFTYRAC